MFMIANFEKGDSNVSSYTQKVTITEFTTKVNIDS